jgi:hypothetical protein
MDSTSSETSKVLTKKERYIKIATIVILNAAFIIFFGFATAHYINESKWNVSIFLKVVNISSYFQAINAVIVRVSIMKKKCVI